MRPPAAPLVVAALAGCITQLAVRTLAPTHPIRQALLAPLAVLQTQRATRANRVGPHPADDLLHGAAVEVCRVGIVPVLATFTPAALLHTLVGSVPTMTGEAVLEATRRWLVARQPAVGVAFTVAARAFAVAGQVDGRLDVSKAGRRVLQALTVYLTRDAVTSRTAALRLGGRALDAATAARVARRVARHAEQETALAAAVATSHDAARSAAERERLRLLHEVHMAQRALQAAGGPVADRLRTARRDAECARADAHLQARRLAAETQRAVREHRRAAHAEQQGARERERTAALEAQVARLEALLRAHAVLDDAGRPETTSAGRTDPAPADGSTVAVEPPAGGEAPSLPPDVLAGERVYVFTGQERSVARQDMRAAFERLGATVVDVVLTTRKHRTPEHFPAEALVVLDVRFMGHKASEYIKRRAQASGCWVYEGHHGASMLALAAAERRLQARAHAALQAA